MTPDEAVKHVWLAGHANQIANMVNMSISSGKQDSRKGTTKSIQSLTVRQIETGIRFCYTILFYDSVILFRYVSVFPQFTVTRISLINKINCLSFRTDFKFDNL